MKAIILNCTLKKSDGDEESNTQALVDKAVNEFKKYDTETEVIRIADYHISSGTNVDDGDGDQWPGIFSKIQNSDIVIIASPVWMGNLCSLGMRVLEKLDSVFHDESQSDEKTGQYWTYGKVAGALITGNEDGAHSCASLVLWAMQEYGFTIPPNVNAYWVGEAGPGPSYIKAGGERSLFTNKTLKWMVANLCYFAQLLKKNPIPVNLKELTEEAKKESDEPQSDED